MFRTTILLVGAFALGYHLGLTDELGIKNPTQGE